MSSKGPTGLFGTGRGGNVLPSNESQLNHIFGDRPGHLPDTLDNRQLLVDVANDIGNYMGADEHGNQWFVRLESDESQIWVIVRDGIIQNGGRNKPPRTWDGSTGLSKNPYKGGQQ